MTPGDAGADGIRGNDASIEPFPSRRRRDRFPWQDDAKPWILPSRSRVIMSKSTEPGSPASSDPGVPDDGIVRIRIDLRGSEPRIRRRVEVPVSVNFAHMHDIIQGSMGWLSYHLYEFTVGSQGYVDPGIFENPEEYGHLDVRDLTLKTVIEQGIGKFQYWYDFGDDWYHDVRIGKLRNRKAGMEYPAYIDGTGRCPPEDVGGVYGFMGFLEKIRDPEAEDHERMLEWYGGPFDPDDIDEEGIHASLRRVVEQLSPKPAAGKRKGRRRKG